MMFASRDGRLLAAQPWLTYKDRGTSLKGEFERFLCSSSPPCQRLESADIGWGRVGKENEDRRFSALRFSFVAVAILPDKLSYRSSAQNRKGPLSSSTITIMVFDSAAAER